MSEEDRDVDCEVCGGRLVWTGEMGGRLEPGFDWWCPACACRYCVAA